MNFTTTVFCKGIDARAARPFPLYSARAAYVCRTVVSYILYLAISSATLLPSYGLASSRCMDSLIVHCL